MALLKKQLSGWGNMISFPDFVKTYLPDVKFTKAQMDMAEKITQGGRFVFYWPRPFGRISLEQAIEAYRTHLLTNNKNKK